MIVHDCKQGTSEWRELRAGIPTASAFDLIITPTGKPSTSAARYMHQLLAERMMGRPLDGYISFAMERGSAMEAEAVSYYELERDLDTVAVGFVTNDAGTIGASPDRCVGDDGLLEIKCPLDHTHVSYLLGKPIDKKYFPQLQGQLWVTERQWVDILSYHPEMPPAIVRVERDEEFIKLLSGAVTSLSLELEAAYEQLAPLVVKTSPPVEESLWLTADDIPAELLT